MKPRLGLCSNWLKGRNIGTRVPIWTREGTFSFPKDSERPLVMVGPGTGVAPFRSILSKVLQAQRQTQTQIAMFFGCRGKEKDFYFDEEWTKCKSAFSNFHFFPAFSRDQEDKVYVQHLILKEEFLLRKLIWEQKGSFFIAGNSKQMPDQVITTRRVIKILKTTNFQTFC